MFCCVFLAGGYQYFGAVPATGVLDCVVSRKGGFRLLARCFATTSSK